MTEEELKKILLDDCAEFERLSGRPAKGRDMINDYGPIEAVKKLVCAGGEGQGGFKFLMNEGKPEHTMEYRVLEHLSFFSKEIRTAAEWRLKKWGWRK